MAKKLWSYRSGDVKENLGLTLLSGIGAVAPVPREEDIGADAIVTLFEPESKFLFPRESFYAQLKSSKVSEIIFNRDAVEWLRLIALPLFIGRVDGEAAILSLYSTNLAYEHFTIDEKYESITMRFGDGMVEDSPRHLTVYLQDPVLRWAMKDVFDETFRQQAYAIMSSWLEIEGDNVRLRRSGIYSLADWKTNVAPKIAIRGLSIGSVPPEEFHRTLRYIEPLLVRLMAQMASHGGLATEFPEYMLSVYSRNGVECSRIKYLVDYVFPTIATRQKSGLAMQGDEP